MNTTNTFTTSDLKILSFLNQSEIQNYIDKLSSYKNVKWIHGDSGRKYELDQLPESNAQSLPDYPDWLLKMGYHFMNICDECLQNFNFNQDNSLDFDCGTTMSPSTITYLIGETYRQESFNDGVFGRGIINNRFLKMMLHLDDCLSLYKKTDSHIGE